jgi:hypothetical protein
MERFRSEAGNSTLLRVRWRTKNALMGRATTELAGKRTQLNLLLPGTKARLSLEVADGKLFEVRTL